MSMMPAFSPGPCTTRRLRVGKRLRCTRDDLYEQCSLHMTLKIPSSVSVGVRPSDFRMRWYSSGVMLWSRNSSGVMAGSWAAGVADSTGFMATRGVESLFSHGGGREERRKRGILGVGYAWPTTRDSTHPRLVCIAAHKASGLYRLFATAIADTWSWHPGKIFNSQPIPLALVGNSNLARTTVSRPALRFPHP